MKTRSKCVVCFSNKVEGLIEFKKYPIKFMTTKESDSISDIYINQELLKCVECGCVQLKYLVEPELLYDLPHNTSGSKVWDKHIMLLTDLILKETSNIINKEIVEIGGSSGILANSILTNESNIDYMILDLCNNPNIKNIKFIEGNCETYNFNTDSIIVMSHVFEHLYEPRIFIENLKKNKVKNIFISIPNMRAQIKNNIHPVIYQEHTYLCEEIDIEYMFNIYKYKLNKKIIYDIHAILFHFILDEDINYIITKNSNLERIDTIKKMYDNKSKIINNIKLEEKYYIIPASFSGQLIYYNLCDKYKRNILGFLDNDKGKKDKRFYGTNSYIYSMEKVKEYNDNLTILIHNGAYINEIIEQLSMYKSNINFIVI